MCHTWIKQHSSRLITNGNSTFDYVPRGFGVLIGECKDLPCCLGPLLLAVLSLGSLLTPTLIVLSPRLLLRCTCLLWNARLLGQFDELAEWQLELSEVREAEASGATLGGVGNS